MATEIWVNTGSGNGLLPDGIKSLPEQMLDLSSVKSSDIHLMATSLEIPQPSITKCSLKITYLKSQSNLPGANELTAQAKWQQTTRTGGKTDYVKYPLKHISVGETTNPTNLSNQGNPSHWHIPSLSSLSAPLLLRTRFTEPKDILS